VQWINIELLQGQMKLCTKVVATMQQRPAIVQSFASMVGAHFDRNATQVRNKQRSPGHAARA
jgi:hypothetical protein